MNSVERGPGISRALERLSPDRSLIWAILALANAAALLMRWSSGGWLIQSDGTLLPHDYLAQWAAGFRVLNDQAALVYNWDAQVALQTKLIGATTPVKLYIFYPPHFLFTTPLFTWLEPLPAFVAFLGITVALYTAALRLLVNNWTKAALVALAGGGAFSCLLYVQNGFLTAALLAAGLASLPTKPRLAGVLFGILTIKPQLGILIPFALAAAGYWRTIGWAAGTFIILALLAEIVMGPGMWAAFIHSSAQTTEFLQEGNLWYKIQSFFAFSWPFLGATGAYLLHATIAAGVAWAVFRLWRDPTVSHWTRASGLIAGSLLMSPYLYAYDAVPMTAAALMLLRANPNLPFPDRAGLVAACILPGLAAYLLSAAVPLAAIAILVLALRQSERRSDSPIKPELSDS